jgi:GDP-L-fucose synthase
VLVGLLRELGADVYSVRSSEHDLRTADGTHDAIAGASVVFHLAARVGGIGFNQRHPAVLVHDNLLLAAHIFEQSRLARVDRLVAPTSVCAYPALPSLPFREQELWDGYPEASNAPYGVAKRVLLTLSEAYWAQYNLRSCTPILTNLYGPGDHADLENSHVVAALIRKFSEARARPDEPVVVWGTGRPTRDFLFVEDGARALILAAERTDRPFAVNIGSGVERSIAELVAIIASLCGFQGQVEWDDTRPDGQPRRMLDVSRARELLGFAPKFSLEEGLRRTVSASALSSPSRAIGKDER